MTPDPGSPWCLPTPVAPGDYHSRAPCRLPGTQSPILLPYLLAPVARSSSYDTRPLAVSPWFLPTPVAPSTSQGPRQLPQKAPSRLAGIQAPVSTQHLPSPLAPGGLPGRVPCKAPGNTGPCLTLAPTSSHGPRQFLWPPTSQQAPTNSVPQFTLELDSSRGPRQLPWLKAASLAPGSQRPPAGSGSQHIWVPVSSNSPGQLSTVGHHSSKQLPQL